MHFWSKDAIIIENIDFHWFHNSPLRSARAGPDSDSGDGASAPGPGCFPPPGPGPALRGRVTELAADSRGEMSSQS